MRIDQLHELFLEHQSVSTDTRNIQKNAIFFALKGDNFNGNQFAEKALESGASYAVIDDETFKKNSNYIVVRDVLVTLQDLATYHRRYLDLKIIALTGSNGKTTTKELINNVLRKGFQTIATKGNLNNHIGVPLTLLSMTKDTDIGIVEMGANHLKEISLLCNIAEPNFGYITNFGKAHLEGFGGVQGVIKGKSELYDHIIEAKGLLFINNDDEVQLRQIKNYKNIFTFGKNPLSDVTTTFIKAEPYVTIRYENSIINSQLIGAYNYHNISAAICMGHYFGISNRLIQDAIEHYVPNNNRSQVIHKNGNKIILDAYNANPTSMIAALDNLSNISDSNKIAILGDMFELGEDAASEHQYIATYAANLELQQLFLVGSNFYETKRHNGKHIVYCRTFEDLKAKLEKTMPTDTTILIKGSRGMALERALQLLE